MLNVETEGVIKLVASVLLLLIEVVTVLAFVDICLLVVALSTLALFTLCSAVVLAG